MSASSLLSNCLNCVIGMATSAVPPVKTEHEPSPVCVVADFTAVMKNRRSRDHSLELQWEPAEAGTLSRASSIESRLKDGIMLTTITLVARVHVETSHPTPRRGQGARRLRALPESSNYSLTASYSGPERMATLRTSSRPMNGLGKLDTAWGHHRKRIGCFNPCARDL